MLCGQPRGDQPPHHRRRRQPARRAVSAIAAAPPSRSVSSTRRRAGVSACRGGDSANSASPCFGDRADSARRRRQQRRLDAHRHAQHRARRRQRVGGDPLDKAAQFGGQRRCRQDFGDRLQPLVRHVVALAVPDDADNRRGPRVTRTKLARLRRGLAFRRAIIERPRQRQRQQHANAACRRLPQARLRLGAGRCWQGNRASATLARKPTGRKRCNSARRRPDWGVGVYGRPSSRSDENRARRLRLGAEIGRRDRQPRGHRLSAPPTPISSTSIPRRCGCCARPAARSPTGSSISSIFCSSG